MVLPKPAIPRPIMFYSIFSPEEYPMASRFNVTSNPIISVYLPIQDLFSIFQILGDFKQTGLFHKPDCITKCQTKKLHLQLRFTAKK